MCGNEQTLRRTLAFFPNLNALVANTKDMQFMYNNKILLSVFNDQMQHYYCCYIKCTTKALFCYSHQQTTTTVFVYGDNVRNIRNYKHRPHCK